MTEKLADIEVITDTFARARRRNDPDRARVYRGEDATCDRLRR
jgi:hypothetical protein